MFGFIKRKGFKVIAVNIVQELVTNRLSNASLRGVSIDDISHNTGLNIIATAALMNRLLEYGIVEEHEWLDRLHYKSADVPDSLDFTSSPNAIFGYAKRQVDRVNFSGL